ncbi:chaperonin 10-like protein [Leptodontidium sp. MPI-SDFR-AT-0119]|nr:chaperonin 10-like protein [Leptodontidium sp. MPI-SDFR-AT-0119]
MPVNRILWQDEPGVPAVIRESPLPTELEDRKLLIKVHAWAMNPADAMLQDKALSFIKYPVVLGQDVAGTVEAVGSLAASRFKVGDRVFGFTINNGFKDYAILDHALTAVIPNNMAYRDVVVFSLCMTTSSFGLFGKDFLHLERPQLTPVSRGKSVLVWGGASAVGSNAIQYLKAAGYEVVTTCSPHNNDYVKGLGASKVFDYNSPTATDDVAAELDKGECEGIYLAAGKVADVCEVSHKAKQKLFVVSSRPVMPGDAPEGVEVKMVFGISGPEAFAETMPITFGGFVPEALARGLYKVAPTPQVVPTKGLEGIQEALDILKKGASATKLVVEAE